MSRMYSRLRLTSHMNCDCDLRSRVLARSLPSCLFTSIDYSLVYNIAGNGPVFWFRWPPPTFVPIS
ncbi:hypothetical protein J6590_033787 [Homalodisca vitripennis]|nr:hypothetical protein J6590_033787 [Homalodisca vitripennis]